MLAIARPDEERAELARELVRSLPESFDDLDGEIERRARAREGEPLGAGRGAKDGRK
jgi:hypothetical protein